MNAFIAALSFDSNGSHIDKGKLIRETWTKSFNNPKEYQNKSHYEAGFCAKEI
jgi:hypothetical protein